MKIIIVGLGWAGQAHFRAIRALQQCDEDCCVVAVVDTDAQHLAATASELDASCTHANLAEAISAHDDANAVVVATPHDNHRLVCEQAAAAGMNVLVEKPVAVTLADADAMIEACDKAGVTLMVAESARYNLPQIEAAEVVASGRIGQILSGRVNSIGRGRHTYSYSGRRAWLADPATPGAGIWMLNGIHEMSAARMLFGQVNRIYARQVNSDKYQSPLEATIVAMVSFDTGAEVTVTLSAELHGYERFADILVFGSEGTLYLQRSSGALTVCTEQSGTEVIDCSEGPQAGASPNFVRQLQEFIQAVEEQREPETGGQSERETLAAILAGYESVRTGDPVELEHFERQE